MVIGPVASDSLSGDPAAFSAFLFLLLVKTYLLILYLGGFVSFPFIFWVCSYSNLSLSGVLVIMSVFQAVFPPDDFFAGPAFRNGLMTTIVV